MKAALVCFFLLTAFLAAEEKVGLTRQAEAFFQAKQYRKAYDLYAPLLTENFAPWQKARLQYNLGTLLIWEGEVQEAARRLAEVPFSIENSPYLTRALQTNLAVLNFRLGRSLLKDKKMGLESYSQAANYFRRALDHVERAEMAECRLQVVKGLATCRPKEDLKRLKAAVKNRLARLLNRYGNFKLAAAPPKEGVPYLIYGVNLGLSHLDFLASMPASNPLKEAYQKLFAFDMQAWGSLWDIQVEQLPELQEAHKAFEEGTRLLDENMYGESKLAYADAAKQLAQLMQQLWGDDPFMESLREILVAYQYALDQFPIQSAAVYQVAVMQKKVNELAADGDDKKKFLMFSNKQLEKALQYARSGQGKRSRLFLDEARQWIRRILRSDDPQPVEILQFSLQEQEHALTISHLLGNIEQEDGELQALLKEAQSFTLKTAKLFLKAVVAKQKREWPQRCQCTPWDRVIPLFVKGEEAAKAADRLLEQEAKDPLGRQRQQEALDYWKEALDALQHPEERKKEEKQPPPPQEEERSRPMDEVMRQLQKMHRDDRKPGSDVKQPQKGIRPW